MNGTKSPSVESTDHCICGSSGQPNGIKIANVPDGLEQFLLDFTVSILRSKPDNLYEYSLRYFTLLNEKMTNDQNVNKRTSTMASGLIALDEDTRAVGSPASPQSCSITITTEDPGANESDLVENSHGK